MPRRNAETTDPAPDRPEPVRPTHQRRSRETRDAILDVVAEFVRDGRFETATVQDIATAAGSSVGGFYGRFADKTAVLFSFYDARCTEQEAKWARLLDPTDPIALRLQLGRLIEHIVTNTLAHAAFLRASRQYFSTSEATPFMERARALNARLYELLLPVLRAHRNEFDHPHIESATLFVMAMVGGLTRDAVLTGSALTNAKVGRRRFVNELKRAAFGYLGLK